MKTEQTIIYHGLCAKFGLTYNEYVVAYAIYQQQNDPKAVPPGWCIITHKELGEMLGFARQTISSIIARLIEARVLFKAGQVGCLRTTQLWDNNLEEELKGAKGERE